MLINMLIFIKSHRSHFEFDIRFITAVFNEHNRFSFRSLDKSKMSSVNGLTIVNRAHVFKPRTRRQSVIVFQLFISI